MILKNYCTEDRPREKLLLHGPAALGNAELLAILLRTGSGGENVLELAGRILAESGGSLLALSARSVMSLCAVKGVGPDKASTVAAAFELGRRWAAEPSDLARLNVSNAGFAARLLGPRLRGLDREECWVMFLNRRNNPLGFEQFSFGSADSTVIDIRRIVLRALEKNASAVILFHNHPSGDPTPGFADVAMTSRLRGALETFSLKLLDHIIVSDERSYSFAEEKIFPTFAEQIQNNV